MPASAPNIVVVMADQHRADVLGCAGDASAQTPNIDRLSAEGTRFSRASCQGPLCMPARASFLTERYVRDHGVYTNSVDVAQGTPTYVHALREAGYHTAHVGKAHLTDERYEDDVSHVDDLAFRLEERGFAEVHETTDKFTGSTPNAWTDALAERGVLADYRRYIGERNYAGEHNSGQGATKTLPMWEAIPTPVPDDLYIDVWHGDVFTRWVEGYNRDQPFFVFFGFPGPHDPWDAPRSALARYDGADMTMPTSTRRPDVASTGRYGMLVAGLLAMSDTETMADDGIRAMRRAYSANITLIDDAVGKIVGALEARGLLENTWIIYTSDHGEMGGNHGLMSKVLQYEPAVRVPLIVRPPGGVPARVVDSLVEHVDVPAMVRDIAGAPAVPQSEGRSLLGYVDGVDPEPRSVVVSETFGFASFETDRYKLVVDEDSLTPCQLFDLHEDPVEDENLVQDPQSASAIGEIMETHVRPFLATPAFRPHPSPLPA
jgi:choline-sulfatase